jgi:hypothetical protein
MKVSILSAYRSVMIYQATDSPELGTVLDGTKCGDEMVSITYLNKLVDFNRRYQAVLTLLVGYSV